ncbi:TRAP transporter substrate-binding protein [soil metagenome]
MRYDARWLRPTISLAAILVLVVALVGCGARGGGAGGGDGENFTIGLSHVTTEDTPKGLASQSFKELAEEKSEGRITVEVYPNSQLYGDEDELQALQSGAIQMLAPSSAKFTTIASQLQVLDLPFLFDAPEEIPEVVSRDSQIGQAIFENQALADANIKVMGLWDNGFMQLTANRELASPEDMNGLKVRIQPSDVIQAQMETWGAEPTPMAFAEVYNALQQGVIDGQENTYSNIFSQKFHTVQSNMTESSHHYLGYVLVINNDFYEQLPEDLKQTVTEAADEASTYNREIALEENTQAKEQILETDIQFTELSAEQRQAFKDQVVPAVWDEFADVVGEDIIQELKDRQETQEK